MRRATGVWTSVTILVATGLALGVFGPLPADARQSDKVEVCHRPPDDPSNYHTISVSANAVAAHLAHGDLLGPCETQCPALCDDGNACTIDSGVWDAGARRCACLQTPVVCGASDQCHDAGVCDPGTGLCSNPPKPDGAACSDGNVCTRTDTCQAGTCVGASPVVCTASDQCHDAGACDPATGVCSNPAKPDGAACNDGNACTQADTCRAGTCEGASPVVCTASDQCRDAGTCDPATGVCSNPAKPDGAACNDGNACTQVDACEAGTCVGVSPVVCAASDQCLDAGSCDPATGVCSNPAKPDGAACSDGNACTQVDACEAGTCLGRSPVVCAASDQCHEAGTCDPATGACSDPARPDGATCDDGDPATAGEHCTAGVCGGGEPIFKPTTCREIRAANPGTSLPDGIYTVDSPSGPVPVYCDMTTDGGGWTAIFVGKNGSTNVFDHFDFGYTGAFNDPGSDRYLQRAPLALKESAAEIAVSCGPAMVKFAMTVPVQDFLVDGAQSGWTPLTPTVIAGSVSTVPNTLWTGSGADQSFIFARNQSSGGNTFASSYNENAFWDFCDGVSDRMSVVRVFYREVAPAPERNTPAMARESCRAIYDAGESTGDGIYWLAQGSGAPYEAYCDMTTDGGGWTAVFAGRNGSVNVFDHFDAPGHAGICTDPASHCVRRAPSSLGDSATEVAVSCGPAMVKFPLTVAVRNWLVSGAQSDWEPLTPTVIAGLVPNVPNTLWTGSGANESFIFARNQSSGDNTFASSYNENGFFDFCNGAADRASMVRVYYREVTPTPVRNTPADARDSCRAIRDAGGAAGDGIYWISQGGGTPYQAYCDMTTDGGGWTAAFAGRNGSVNVFDHFDAGAHAGVCTDPATHCVRRGPPSLGYSATDLAVSCGPAMVKFPLTVPARNWLADGTQAAWTPLTPTVIAGSVSAVPNTLWTGSGANESFIFARNQSSGGNTFASSYNENGFFDFCNGLADQASLVRVYYRDATPAPVHNTPTAARVSCRAIRDAGESGGDGIYWLAEPGGPPYPAYCDMTTDGGGWTAVFAGRNGSLNVFDHFDATVPPVPPAHAGICTDPATRCLRRAPPSLGAASELAVSCGGAMVKFPLTPVARGWLGAGAQAGWTPLAPAVIAGTVPAMPNTLWTGSGANESFIFARNQSSGGNTFASSYNENAFFDFCNGAPDAASLTRLYYR